MAISWSARSAQPADLAFPNRGYATPPEGTSTTGSQEKCYVSSAKVILSGAGRYLKAFAQVRAHFAELQNVLVLVTERGVWRRITVLVGWCCAYMPASKCWTLHVLLAGVGVVRCGIPPAGFCTGSFETTPPLAGKPVLLVPLGRLTFGMSDGL